MTNTGLSAGDILALTKDKDGFLEGNGIIILILFFLIFGFGGSWGNKSGDTLSTADYYAGIGNQNLMNDVRNGFSNTAMSICNTDKEILNNRFTTQVGFQNLGASMDSCCCNIRSAIAEDGQKTRELLNAQYQASLLEKINDLKTQVSNNEQTGYILNTMGRWHGYPSCGCGYSNNLI